MSFLLEPIRNSPAGTTTISGQFWHSLKASLGFKPHSSGNASASWRRPARATAVCAEGLRAAGRRLLCGLAAPPWRSAGSAAASSHALASAAACAAFARLRLSAPLWLLGGLGFSDGHAGHPRRASLLRGEPRPVRRPCLSAAIRASSQPCLAAAPGSSAALASASAFCFSAGSRVLCAALAVFLRAGLFGGDPRIFGRLGLRRQPGTFGVRRRWRRPAPSFSAEAVPVRSRRSCAAISLSRWALARSL